MEMIKRMDLDGAPQSPTIPNVRTLLRSAWERYKAMVQPLAMILSVQAIALLAHLSLTIALQDMATAGLDLPAWAYLEHRGQPFSPVALILFLAVTFWSNVALLLTVVSGESGLGFSSAYRQALKKIPSFLWISVLVWLATLGGFLLLIVPGIIFIVWFSFAFFVFIAEGNRGLSALRRSREYVRGRWASVAWRVFAGPLLIALIAFGITIALGVGGVLLGVVLALVVSPAIGATVGVGSLLASRVIDLLLSVFLFQPLMVIYLFMLYRSVSGTWRDQAPPSQGPKTYQ